MLDKQLNDEADRFIRNGSKAEKVQMTVSGFYLQTFELKSGADRPQIILVTSFLDRFHFINGK